MVNNPAFAAGSHYVYKVTINNSDITVTGKMVDWDEVTPVEVSKKLITVADVNIEDVQNVSITNGSKLIVSLTENGESTPISTDMVFTYNSTDQKWVVTPNTELYWDDLKLPLAKAEALLKINNTNNAEDLFYASKTEGLTINTSSSTAQSISFGETFVRPLAKMTFKIISDYTQVTGATAQDQITLSKLDNSGASVVIPDSKIHVVNGTKVTESTGSSLVNAVKSSESTATEYIYTAYIMPKTNSTTLCEITIPESGFANVYTPRLSTAINFVAGKHYTYTINITKSGISFTGKLVDWDPVNGGDIISTL
ncbi:fimbrillin family protein, partial [Porphyromonadaceae bacterium OttesenSCG-928-L07]|nr:fimbrillin family protein [Porphyromonadaceae bacterium OttesenSCG-928-L07]